MASRCGELEPRQVLVLHYSEAVGLGKALQIEVVAAAGVACLTVSRERLSRSLSL